jgi:hypothetical protein
MVTDCGHAASGQDYVVAVLGSPDVTSYPANTAGRLDEACGFLTEAEMHALGVLADAGMVPPLRENSAGRVRGSGRRRGPGSSLTSKRRDGSVTTSFLRVNRRIVMK